VIVFFALGFLGEPLPFLGHFREERFEPRINCSASFLKAPRGESSICSCALHLSPTLGPKLPLRGEVPNRQDAYSGMS
jgi:hypothetical protein